MNHHHFYRQLNAMGLSFFRKIQRTYINLDLCRSTRYCETMPIDPLLLKRKIIHIDMDCFYAAVECRDRPDLGSKPVAVGGRPEGRGVIATANYSARKFGVHSAMSSRRAVALCPNLTILRPDFVKYKNESKKIFEILKRYSNVIETISLDEAYLDVTEASHSNGIATKIAKAIRQDIWSELKLTASAGIAPNKFLAKIASDWNKPNGQKTIRPEDVSDFVKTLKVNKINGVGPVTTQKLNSMGLFTCQDIQKQNPLNLTINFGKYGRVLAERSMGIDDRKVEMKRFRKSLSTESTFFSDESPKAILEGSLMKIYLELEKRFNRLEKKPPISGQFVKVKSSDFKTTTFERSARNFPTYERCVFLFNKATERMPNDIRLVGLGLRFEVEEKETDQLKFLF